MPSYLYRELAMKDIKGYKENGCKIPTIELSPEGWNCCQPILVYLHKGGRLQKFPGVQAYIQVLPARGRMAQSTTIKLQRNKRAHLTYCSKLNFVVLNGIVTLENWWK